MPLVQTAFRPAGSVLNVNGSGLGSAQWTNAPNAIGSPDSSYATCTISNSTDPSYYLRADDFNFVSLGIPNDAMISGVYARITRKSNNTFNVKDDHITLFTPNDGVFFSGNRTYGKSSYPGSIDFWGTSDGTSLYGGTGDFLGLSSSGFLASWINQSGFGFAFSCSGSVTPQTASVDSLEMSVLWVSGLKEATLTLFLMADTQSSGGIDLYTQGANFLNNLDNCTESFSPNQASGMVGWWDTHLGNDVLLDPVTSGVSTNNQPAGLWLNRIGTNNLRQPTFAKKPTYFDNGTGFLNRPFISFDGTDDSLFLTSGITLNTDFSIWFVNSFLDGNSNVNNALLSATGDLLTTIRQSGLTLFTSSNTASGTTSTHPSISTDFGIRYIERAGNTITYKPNGINGTSHTINNISGIFSLGSLGERLNTNFFKGNISSLYIYNQVNTTEEQENITNYLNGITGVPCHFTLYTFGHAEQTNGVDLFLYAPQEFSGNPLDLYLHNTLTSGNQLDLFVSGPILFSGLLDQNLFVAGPMPHSGFMNLFLKTNELFYISTSGRRQFSPTLYLRGSPLGTGIQENSLNLFLESSRHQASLNLFTKVDDSRVIDTYMNLYMNGAAYTDSKSLMLYVGASGETKALNLYTKGRGFYEANDPLHPSDGFYPLSGGMNLFILRDPAEMLNLFLMCQMSSGDLPLYVNGAFTNSSGINLVIPFTLDSGRARQLLFTRGGV